MYINKSGHDLRYRYYNQENYEKTIEQLNLLYNKEPNNFDINYYYEVTYNKLNEIESSKKYIQSTVE